MKEKFKSEIKTKHFNLDESPSFQSNVRAQSYHADRLSLLATNPLRTSAEDSISLMHED